MNGEHETWVAGIRAVETEAAGVVSVEVIRPIEAAELMVEAMSGNAESEKRLRVIARAAKRIAATRSTRRPSLCASCPRALLDNKFAFVIAVPTCDDPTNALALAVCRKCGTSTDQIQRKATFALKKLWPHLRPIYVHPTGGRA